MATQKEPYIERNPGDLVSAGDWNQVQVDIKDDILAAKEAAKEEIREEGTGRPTPDNEHIRFQDLFCHSRRFHRRPLLSFFSL